jgi:hypothetical protein
MAQARLDFSVSKLLGLAFGSILLGTAAAGLGWELSDRELMRHAHVLGLLGPHGARWSLIAMGLAMAGGGSAAARRAFGDRPAAAIRYDGIELTGVFVSRFIPWRSLDRLRLRQWRYRGTTHHYIKADARRPAGGSRIRHFLAGLSYGVSTGLIDASDEDAARWVEAANAARPRALPAYPSAAVRRAGLLTRIGFGRRST